MRTINLSVGKSGINRRDDVSTVQQLLNENLYRLIPFTGLAVDGICGKKTIALIKEFQRRVLKVTAPDGRVDPNGKTFEALKRGAKVEHAAFKYTTFFQPRGLCFPLETRPQESYRTGMRRFGANRGGGRKHAGADLYAPVGTPILAMADGVVIDGPYAFYLGTQAVEIEHKDFWDGGKFVLHQPLELP